jgi:hypothetical protein
MEQKGQVGGHVIGTSLKVLALQQLFGAASGI